MITDRTLAHLRTSASLALLVPGLSVAVRVGEATVVEATRPPFPDVGHPLVPVCAFHRSVDRALELRRSGARVEMVGIAGDLEPVVDVLAGDGLKVVPGGVVRRQGETWFHFCPLSLPVARVEAIAATVAAETGIEILLHADRSLDVTVAVTDTPRGDRRLARAAIDALEQVAASATVEAIVDLIQPGETDWDALLAGRRP